MECDWARRYERRLETMAAHLWIWGRLRMYVSWEEDPGPMPAGVAESRGLPQST